MSNLPSMRLGPHELVCDAPNCGHVEKVLEIVASMIGKPCPKCGASLLTDKDFVAGKTMLAALEAIAAALPPSDGKPGVCQRMTFNPHDDAIKIEVFSDEEVRR